MKILREVRLPQAGECIALVRGELDDPAVAIVGCSCLTGNTWDGNLCLVNLESGKIETELKTFGGNCAVESLKFGTASYFFSGGDDGAVYCWRYNKNNQYNLNSEEATTVAKHENDNSSNERPVFNFFDHQNVVSAIAANHSASDITLPQSSLVLSASWDTTVKLWDMENAWPLRTFHTSARETNDVEWNPRDPCRFISGSRGKVVMLWDHRSAQATGRVVFDSSVIVARHNPLSEFEFAVGTNHGSIKLIDSRKLGHVLSQSATMTGAIRSLHFSPSNAGLLAMAADDGRVAYAHSWIGGERRDRK